MAKTDPNSELLAQLIADNAAMRKRLDFVETYEPIAKALRAQAAVQKARDARVKARAISSVSDYDALTSQEKKEVPAQVLIDVLRTAKKSDRARVLADVTPRDWRVAAQLAFALAPAPDPLVEVTCHRTFERTSPVRLASDEQRKQLEELGLPAYRTTSDGRSWLRGFTAEKNERVVFDAASWDARCEADPRLVAWLADRYITVRRFTDDEARAYALKLYMTKHAEAQVYPELAHAGNLPELPPVQ